MISAALRERGHATRPRPADQGPGLPRPQAGVDAAVDARGRAGEGEPRLSAAGALEACDKTEVLARGSSGSTGRTTAWVAVHAGTPEQRATTHGTASPRRRR